LIFDFTLLVTCFVLLGASAFFSGSETALFALDARQRYLLRKRQDRAAQQTATLLGQLGDTLILLLICNTFVNILLAILATRLFIRHLGAAQGALFGGITVTAMILLFGEILPKSAAVGRPLFYSLRIAQPLLKLGKLFEPLTRSFRSLSGGVLGIAHRVLPGDDLDMRGEEMLALLSLGVEEGSIGGKERELVRGVFELGETPVHEIMTPRVDLFLLDEGSEVATALPEIRQAGFSWVPLWGDSPEKVTGLLEAARLLGNETESRPLADWAIAPHFCPESQRAGPLLRELLEEGTELAVVLDEYGALAGLVTLQDLFEVLIGDILGRRDFVSQRFYMPDEDTLIASSRMELERVEELLAIELDADDVETLGGYLMKILGEVPEQGRRYVRNGVTWTVLNAEGPALGMIKLESER
jgi:putative hemolysin